jgi:hypothetical protein
MFGLARSALGRASASDAEIMGGALQSRTPTFGIGARRPRSSRKSTGAVAEVATSTRRLPLDSCQNNTWWIASRVFAGAGVNAINHHKRLVICLLRTRGGRDHRGEPGAKKENLRLDDLSRVPAQTKALVMQIVAQTKQRSGGRCIAHSPAWACHAVCTPPCRDERILSTRSVRDAVCVRCCPKNARRSASLRWAFRRSAIASSPG